MANELILSFQTRLTLTKEVNEVLRECAYVFNAVEHCLYREVAKGNSSASCKNAFLKKYGITARQFNACRVNLEGKISACKASQERALITLKEQINKLDQHIKRLAKKPSKLSVLHQKKRRKGHLSARLCTLEEDLTQGRTRLCFGGKKIFNAQFYLKENGYASHAEWKKAWEAKRNSEFFILGSKDETGGNQTCTASLQENGRLTLRLRLPKSLEKKYGKYLEMKDVLFAYGHEELVSSLKHSKAISYRFKKDEKSWRVFALTAIEKQASSSLEGNGAIGLDLNADHIAYVEIDRFGNPLNKKIFPWVLYGKTKGQAKAITGNICKEIVDLAKTLKKPIIIEKLDFHKRKLALQDNPKYARLLSSFAYSLFFSFLNARSYKQGIDLHQVNPAFTSIIGHVNYAKRYGLSIHLAAALCIARRHFKFSEAPCSSPEILRGKEGYVAFELPVRNRTKPLWHFWGQVKKKIATVHAAQYRAHKRSLSPPMPTPVIGTS